MLTRKEYYIYREEAKLFEQYSAKIAARCGDIQHVVDLGCGSADSVAKKAIPLLYNFKALESYTALDINKSAVKDATQCVTECFPNIQILEKTENMYARKKLFSLKDNALFILVGTTISNIPEKMVSPIPQQTRSSLLHLRAQMPTGSYFLVGYDANIDRHSSMAAYDNLPLKGLILSLMYNIAKDVPNLGFDPRPFDCVTTWDNERKAVDFNIKSTTSQTFFMCGDQKVSIQRGDHFHVGSSQRYTVPVFTETAQQAGFESVDYFQTPKKRMTLHLLKSK